MTSHVKHSVFWIKSDFFHSRNKDGYPTKNIVNTTGCTLANCVPIGLQTINATCRGNFIVPTNYGPPFCRKFIEIYSKIQHYVKGLCSDIYYTWRIILCFLSVYLLFNNRHTAQKTVSNKPLSFLNYAQ